VAGTTSPTTSPLAREPDWLFRLILWSVMFAIPASTVALPLAEFDTGWHLRTGQWIAEHGAIPAVDTFSTVGTDRPWYAYSWLFGLILHHLHQAFGWLGIVVFRAVLGLLVTMAVWFLVGCRERRFIVQAGITAAAAVAMMPILVGWP
jgi:hypothetical protein